MQREISSIITAYYRDTDINRYHLSIDTLVSYESYISYFLHR